MYVSIVCMYLLYVCIDMMNDHGLTWTHSCILGDDDDTDYTVTTAVSSIEILNLGLIYMYSYTVYVNCPRFSDTPLLSKTWFHKLHI